MRRLLFLLIPVSLNAMEEIPLDEALKDVVIDNTLRHSNTNQAARIIDVFFNGNGEELKPIVVPKLSQKLAIARHSSPMLVSRLPNIIDNVPQENNTIVVRAERSPSSEEVFAFAERMLTASLHEIILEKELELESSEKKKKCLGVIAVAEGVGIVTASIAAILLAIYH